MSRVFVGEELQLERKIVVKVLPPDLAAGLNVERFRREIQLAARLQHPHIVPLLSAGARDGLLFYTMPFIVGESLRTRLSRQHELPVHDALRILRDVVDALAYAHSQGVVHRDIKPDNVLLSGHHAVVTDFGVARALTQSSGSSSLTSIGVALGTPAYMSPEQAAADPTVDHRSDIYSVGALAYELLTGRQLFVGMSPQQMLSAHITQAPDPLAKHRSAVSPALEQVIMRCLEKKPADRWQNAEDLLAQLEALSTPSGGLTPQPMTPSVSGPRRWLLVAVASAAIVAVVGVGLLWLRSPAEPLRFVASAQLTNSSGLELYPSLSPDGKTLAFVNYVRGLPHIYVRQTAGGRTIPLTDGMPGSQTWPRWSPDGSELLFVSDGIWAIPALGGSPRRISRRGNYPAWSPDGQHVVYTTLDTVFVQHRDGSGLRAVAIPAAHEAHSPAWSPDGSWIAYVDGNSAFNGSLFNTAPSSIWVVPAEGGAAVRVTDDTRFYASPVWTPDSRQLLYVSNVGGSREIFQQRLTSDGHPAGEAVRLTAGASPHSISLSADGSRLAYSAFTYRRNIWSAPIRSGSRTALSAMRRLTNGNEVVEAIDVSPDGRDLAFDSNRGGNADIYRMPVAGGEATQLTTDPADEFVPRWSWDGRQIAFQSWKHGNRDIFVMNADGTNLTQVTSSPLHQMYPSWSPTGALTFSGQVLPDRHMEAFMMARSANGRWLEPRQVSRSGCANVGAPLSADGKHLVCASAQGLKLLSLTGDGDRLIVDGARTGLRVTSATFGLSPDVVYFRAVDSSRVIGFYEYDFRDGSVHALLRLDDPTLVNPRVEFSTDGRTLYFALAADESDIWVLNVANPPSP